ncbi:nucleotidyltransferase [Flavobacterium sp.]|uniref:nucleotidyltransferase n=1 Tax=Flavobacterium sp. TaxID=239 RepID=UPI0025BD6938|nr:nucleotidyltransferase [Flavobacterium sp.]
MIPEVFEIWKNFDLEKLEYIIIGGFAVNIYGYNRNTGDMNVFFKDTLENRLKLNKALKASKLIEFPNVETMQFIPGYTDVNIGFGMRLDLMTSVKGLEDISFDELLNNATVVEITGVKVNFIDYENLIKSKFAANRIKDILDIEELNKVNSKENKLD